MSRTEEVLARIRKRFTDNGVLGKNAKVGVKSTFNEPSALGAKEVGGQRLIRVMATTSGVDLAREVVDPDGADTTYIDRNRQIFSDHRYDTEYAVGSLRYTERTPKGYAQLVNLRRLTKSPLADDIWTIATDVGIGASIGFDAQEVDEPDKNDPLDWKSADAVIRKWRWLETSLTCFPCNSDCQTLACFSDDSKAAKLDEMVTKGRIRRESAYAVGYEPARPRLVIRMAC